MHNRLPGALPPRDDRRPCGASSAATRAGAIFFFTRAGYTGTPGSAGYEFANFPGDETTDWTPLVRARLADHRHAQPRDRRRLRLHDRHRRLLRRRPVRADDQGAVPALGRVGGAVADVPHPRLGAAPAPTRRGPTTTRRSPSTTASPAAPARPAADHAALAACAPHGDADHPAALARLPARPRGRRAGPGVAARPEGARRAGRRAGSRLARGLLPARLLARARTARCASAARERARSPRRSTGCRTSFAAGRGRSRAGERAADLRRGRRPDAAHLSGALAGADRRRADRLHTAQPDRRRDGDRARGSGRRHPDRRPGGRRGRRVRGDDRRGGVRRHGRRNRRRRARGPAPAGAARRCASFPMGVCSRSTCWPRARFSSACWR